MPEDNANAGSTTQISCPTQHRCRQGLGQPVVQRATTSASSCLAFAGACRLAGRQPALRAQYLSLTLARFNAELSAMTGQTIIADLDRSFFV
jgi:hypothetical protein